MKINNIVTLLLCIGMIYLLFFKKEKMTADANTKKLIQDHYKIDVDAIRNLSKLANDLTKNGKLRVPGGLEVDGNLNIKGESKFYKRTWFQNQKKPNVWSQLNEPNGNIYLRGNVIMDGHGGSGKNLNVNGTSTFNGITHLKNELAIHNGNNKGVTHFNHQNRGNNFIRGDIKDLKLFYRFHMRVYKNATLIKYHGMEFDENWVCIIAGFASSWDNNSDGSGGSSVKTFLWSGKNRWYAETRARHRNGTDGSEVTILAFKKDLMIVNSDPTRSIHFHDKR